MAETIIADDSQAANPTTYGHLIAHAAYQVEALAIALRDFALAHPAEIDTFAISTSRRLRELAGVQMTLGEGRGTSEDVETVWGGSLRSFAETLSRSLIAGDAVARAVAASDAAVTA